MLHSNSDIVKEFKETYLWVKRAEKLLWVLNQPGVLLRCCFNSVLWYAAP